MIQTELLIHDLKIPIAVIDAGVKSLLNRQDIYGPLTEKQEKVLKRIIRNVLAARHLVNDTLELGRSRQGIISAGETSVSDLVCHVLVDVLDLIDPAVSEQVSMAGSYDEVKIAVRQSGVRLTFDTAIWTSVVCLDAAKVQQVLRNLLTNAFKYRSAWVKIGGSRSSTGLVLTVTDDGKGVCVADTDKIFNGYGETGKALTSTVQSHGIGLAGVAALLNHMGGTICVEKSRESGACFIVEIPVTG